MSDQADVSGESYRDIDEKEYSGGTVFRIIPGSELQEYIGEYRHGETAYPDSVPFCEKKKGNADEEGIEQKEKNETASAYKALDLVSENIEEQAIEKEMEDSAVKKLIKEELDDDFDV